jgi:hypothetical protein
MVWFKGETMKVLLLVLALLVFSCGRSEEKYYNKRFVGTITSVIAQPSANSSWSNITQVETDTGVFIVMYFHSFILGDSVFLFDYDYRDLGFKETEQVMVVKNKTYRIY